MQRTQVLMSKCSYDYIIWHNMLYFQIKNNHYTTMWELVFIVICCTTLSQETHIRDFGAKQVSISNPQIVIE